MSNKKRTRQMEDKQDDLVTSGPNKIRRFDHVDGNWPCHVRISFRSSSSSSSSSSSDSDDGCDPENDVSKTVESLANATFPKLSTMEGSGDDNDDGSDDGSGSGGATNIFPVDQPLHVSLSHTFVLRYHQIQSFLLSLRSALLTDAPRVVPFYLVVTNGIQTFWNQNHTRKFYTMQCEGGSEMVRSIIRRVNRVLQKMGQPVYHVNPAIHVSIGWSTITVLDEKKKEGVPMAKVAEEEEEEEVVEEEVVEEEEKEKKKKTSCVMRATLESVVHVVEIQCIVGKQIHRFVLSS